MRETALGEVVDALTQEQAVFAKALEEAAHEPGIILLVDDEQDNTDVYAFIINHECNVPHERILAIHDPNKAIEEIERRALSTNPAGHIALLVCDKNLNHARLNGVDVMQAAHGKVKKAIAVSGDMMPGSTAQQEMLEAGADATYIKPIDFDDLVNEVNDALNRVLH